MDTTNSGGEVSSDSYSEGTVPELPDVLWDVILSNAAAPLQVSAAFAGHIGCLSEHNYRVVSSWLMLSRVCKRWQQAMREQPVALLFDLEGGAERPEFLDTGPSSDPGHALCARAGLTEHLVLHALGRLAAGCLPVCKLHVHVGLRRFMAEADQKMTDAFDAAFRTLLQSADFARSSGRYLTEVFCRSGFHWCAPEGAFPALRCLGIVRTRAPWGLPPGLQLLHVKGFLKISFGSGIISASEIGGGDDVVPHLKRLPQLTNLAVDSCCVSRDFLLALPPTLTRLVFSSCQMAAEDNADLPTQLRSVWHQRNPVGLYSAGFELAGVAIHERGRQLA